MIKNQEREAFEAWFRLHHGNRCRYDLGPNGEYVDKQVQSAFNVWLGRAALAQQAAVAAQLIGAFRMLLAACNRLWAEAEEMESPDGLAQMALQQYWDEFIDARDKAQDALVLAAAPEAPVEQAAGALTALRYRLERIHAACSDARPKQAVGEMIAGMLAMPEWNAAPAGSAPGKAKSYASVTLSGDEMVFLSHLFNVLTMARAGRVFSPTCWDGDRWELADILRKSPDEGLKRDAVAAFPASRYEASRAAPAAKKGGEQS